MPVFAIVGVTHTPVPLPPLLCRCLGCSDGIEDMLHDEGELSDDQLDQVLATMKRTDAKEPNHE